MEDPKRLLETASPTSETRKLLQSHPKTPGIPPKLNLQIESQIENLVPVANNLFVIKGCIVATVVLVAGALLWPLDQSTEPNDAVPAVANVVAPRQTRFVSNPTPPEKEKPKPKIETKRYQPTSNSLAEELKLLDRARAELDKDPNLAMKQVKLHARRYPNGQLDDLRDYLEIQIHKRKGNVADAQRLRDKFFNRHADSAFIRELRKND